jgi:hypothetical protein
MKTVHRGAANESPTDSNVAFQLLDKDSVDIIWLRKMLQEISHSGPGSTPFKRLSL